MSHTSHAALGSALETLIDAIADRVADRVFERIHQGHPGMVDQKASPLGSRRHSNAVKRRLANHQSGAAHVGRRYLLTPKALKEELAGHPTPRPSADAGDALRRKLGLK